LFLNNVSGEEPSKHTLGRIPIENIPNPNVSRPWIAQDAIVFLWVELPLPKHQEKIRLKNHLDKKYSTIENITKLFLAARLTNVKHQNVVCRLFS
jgi:hypothetical protein